MECDELCGVIVVFLPGYMGYDFVDVFNSENLKSLNQLILRDPPHTIHIIKLYQLGRQPYPLLQVLLLDEINPGLGKLSVSLQRNKLHQLGEDI